MRDSLHSIVVSLMLVTASTAAYAAEEGETLYLDSGCANCHGPSGGKAMPGSSKLAGQDKVRLFQVMKEIRSGSREGGMSSVMQPALKELTDSELKAVADWLSSGE